jgi:hypothetical protein
MKPVYFKDWITGWHWGVRIAPVLILLSALVQVGMFLLTQNYMVAWLGAQPEDIGFAVMLTCRYCNDHTADLSLFEVFRNTELSVVEYYARHIGKLPLSPLS